MGFKNFHSCDLPGFAERMTDGVIWQCDECKKKYEAEVDTHWNHVSWNEIENVQDSEKEISLNSDAQKFIDLYESFGMKPYISKVDRGVFVTVIVGHHGRKVTGYNYHYSRLFFDNDGTFVEQVIRE